jgi:hypothetical protein
MARRRRRSRTNGDGWKIGGTAFLALICFGLLGAYALSYRAASDRPVLAQDSLCPTDGPRAATVVVLDASDDLPEITRQEVQSFLTDLSEELEPYSLLELRLLDPEVNGGRIVFSKCNPGDGSNLSELVANPALAHRKWLEQFREPLEQALKGSLAPAPSQTSPIMETVQRVAVDRFTGRAASSIPKRLIVISDMLEHTAAYSHYSGDLSFKQFRQSDTYHKVRTDLHGSEVIIKYVHRLRPDDSRTLKHIEFWREWARDSNGGRFQADRLQGAG